MENINLLLSNDDGYGAQGLMILEKVLLDLDYNICVISPDRNCSGASQSLTLDRPIRIKRLDKTHIIAEGTPTDCTHLALTGIFDVKPNFVVAGINHGANLGNDVLYSGTVAIAREACSSGVSAIAISLTGKRHFETPAFIVAHLLQYIIPVLPAQYLLNINCPDIPISELAGIMITTLGQRKPHEEVLASVDPRGYERFWIGLPGEPKQAELGTDMYAIEHNFLSITPLPFNGNIFLTKETLDQWQVRCDDWFTKFQKSRHHVN